MKLSRNAKGEFLIDRNGRAFEAVLEFHRSGGTFFMIPNGVNEHLVEKEFDYFGLPYPREERRDNETKMVEKLLFSPWSSAVRDVWGACSKTMLQHFVSIAEKGHEEVGINLVPLAAPDHDLRYVELKGKPVGSIHAPLESPVLNVLAPSNKSMQTLLSKRFTEEGFHVTTGERINYFSDGSSLLYLVLSWRHVYSTPFERMLESVERIHGHVESIALVKANNL